MEIASDVMDLFHLMNTDDVEPEHFLLSLLETEFHRVYKSENVFLNKLEEYLFEVDEAEDILKTLAEKGMA